MIGCCWRTIVDQNHEPKDGLFCNVIVRDPIKKTTLIKVILVPKANEASKVPKESRAFKERKAKLAKLAQRVTLQLYLLAV